MRYLPTQAKHDENGNISQNESAACQRAVLACLSCMCSKYAYTPCSYATACIQILLMSARSAAGSPTQLRSSALLPCLCPLTRLFCALRLCRQGLAPLAAVAVMAPRRWMRSGWVPSWKHLRPRGRQQRWWAPPRFLWPVGRCLCPRTCAAAS